MYQMVALVFGRWHQKPLHLCLMCQKRVIEDVQFSFQRYKNFFVGFFCVFGIFYTFLVKRLVRDHVVRRKHVPLIKKETVFWYISSGKALTCS